MTNGKLTRAGIAFGPTEKGKLYLSVFHHRGAGAKNHKTTWRDDVSPPDEFGIFSNADDKDWYSQDGHYWGVADEGMRELGTLGQRVCKFPVPSNTADPWHGYPISPLLDPNDALPDDLVQKWIDDKVVSRTIGKRIQRWKI